QIRPTVDELMLAARAGWRVGRPALQVVPSALAGPVLALGSTGYAVRDPVARTLDATTVSGSQTGLGYGLGLAVVGGDPAGLRLATRLEGVRMHRGTTSDLALQLGIGVAF